VAKNILLLRQALQEEKKNIKMSGRENILKQLLRKNFYLLKYFYKKIYEIEGGIVERGDLKVRMFL
jgi:hypothetical protein